MTNRIADHMSSEGVPVHVRATFISLKGMPAIFSVGHNNLNPELKFFDDRFEIKSVKVYQFSYNDIREISTLKTLGTRNVRFKMKRGMLNHTANIMDDQTYEEVLHFLESREISFAAGAVRQLAKLRGE